MADKPNVKLTKLETATTNGKICGDFYKGALSVLNEIYLPKWTGETDAGYKARLATTAFANMFAPVVDGLAGMVMKKEPIVTGYSNVEDIDLSKNEIQVFIKETIKKSITDGVVFVSVETSKELNRAFMKRYTYDSLYSYYMVDGVLKQIVFKEILEVKSGDFGIEEQERYIVFKVGGGSVWYQKEGEAELKEQDTWENSMQVIPVLQIVTGKEVSPFEYVPKLLDIANLNKVLLNLESNLANVLGVVGNPIPVFFGSFEDKVTLGVKDALVFTDKSKEGFEWVEINGSGTTALDKQIEKVEGNIDKLTFSMLLNTDSNTVIDAQEKQSKNTSFLSDVANEVEGTFKKLLGYMMELENKTVTEDMRFEMHKDFDLFVIDMKIAFDMLQAGDMSRETFYEIMRTGRFPKDFDITMEKQRIESDV